MTISNYNSLFRKIDLALLKHFLDVATYGGFTKASRATGASQPALSLGLKKLEKTLGVKLIRRGGGEFSLTDPGRELLRFCKRFESGLQSVVEGFGSKSAAGQTLRIGTALSVGFGPLVRLCARTGRSHSLVSIELTTQNTYDLIKLIIDSALDAALLPDDIYDARLKFTALYKDQVIFVVGAGQRIRRGEEATLITYPRETPMRATVDKLIHEKQLRFHRMISVNSIEAMKMLVARGVGGAFILKSLVSDELSAGTLVEFRKGSIPLKSGIALATRNDERGAEIVKQVLKLMEQGH